MENNKPKVGFLFGKFMPPHQGHLHLIETSASKVEHLYVLVCSILKEPIPGHIRFHCLQNIYHAYPHISVIHVQDENPQVPEEHPDFWNIWKETFIKHLPQKPDVLFTSELYGEPLAEVMNIQHELIDLDRLTYPISGSAIRHNPLQNWQYIPNQVKPYFAKKIVLTGPESTGKTSLAIKLAEHYQTLWVEEYARRLYNENHYKLEYKDISNIVGGQMHLEDDLAKKCNKLLFCDTDPIATQVWSQIYFNDCPTWITELSYHHRYDLHLLMDIDIPWVQDNTREFPHLREYHFNKIKTELDIRNLPYRIISGDFEERFEKAIEIIDGYFGL